MQLLIADEANSNAPSLNEFILYLQKYYVGQVINGQEFPGKFPKEMWNMYQRVKDGLPRTNNSLEGWHSSFAKGAKHLKLSKLVGKYRQEQHTKMYHRYKHQRGEATNNQRVKYKKETEKLVEIIGKFDRGVFSGLEYLDILADRSPLPTHVDVVPEPELE